MMKAVKATILAFMLAFTLVVTGVNSCFAQPVIWASDEKEQGKPPEKPVEKPKPKEEKREEKKKDEKKKPDTV